MRRFKVDELGCTVADPKGRFVLHSDAQALEAALREASGALAEASGALATIALGNDGYLQVARSAANRALDAAKEVDAALNPPRKECEK